MIPDLFTGEPSWLIIFCLLAGSSYAIGLYFRDKKNEFATYLKILLGIARFFSVFLISFMLLSPFLRSITKEKEKPVIIFAVDNSQSIPLNKDSGFYRSTFLQDADRLAEKLSSTGETRLYTFGNKLEQLKQGTKFAGSINYSEQETDISGMISELGNLYTNLNVGALVLASDGIYNTGANPLYQAKEWPFPVYTIALGDTSSRKDLIIARVNFNRMVFLNNKFPLEVIVRANSAMGSRSKIRVFQGETLLGSQDIYVDKDDFTGTYEFVSDAKQNGLQKIVISIDPVEGELSTSNNRRGIFIEVLDSRSKVLIISGAPHPDISALNQAITSNMNYQVDEVLLNEFKGKVEDYSMVILHQLPSVNEPADALLRSIKEKQVPALYILGSQTDFARFNQWNDGLKITTSPKPVFDESVPFMSQGFAAFSLSENTVAWLSDLPPLITPLGDYKVSNAASILLKQRIGNIETSRPMILFNETLDGRSGVITGEGIWKWRLYNFATTKDHLAFNELINKMVQYLSLKDQKKNFRIYNQTDFRETEPVIFDAEVYNESYELTVEPEVEIDIQNEEGTQFPFAFNKSGNSYHLDAGNFPPGNYTYHAKTTVGTNNLSATGQFSVTAIDLEALNTVADHQLLYQLARGGGGNMVYPGEMDKLADEINAREDIRTVTFTRKKLEALLNNEWLVVLILGLLTLEWFLRKRAGSY